MSFYKPFIASNKYEAHQLFVAAQKKFDQKKNVVMWIATLGGVLVLVIIEHYFGKTASGLCGIVGIVWYLLGYNYCEALLCKQREMTEYREALIEDKKLHPDPG